VVGERPDETERDDLIRQPGAPVGPLRHPELDVQPEQVLFHRRLGHDEIDRDLSRGGRRHEGVVGQRRTAQRGQHVEFAAGQFRGGGPAHLGLGGQPVAGESLHPAARRAEAQHITVVKHAARDWPPVYPRAIA